MMIYLSLVHSLLQCIALSVILRGLPGNWEAELQVFIFKIHG